MFFVGGDGCGGFAFTSAVQDVTVGQFLEASNGES